MARRRPSDLFDPVVDRGALNPSFISSLDQRYTPARLLLQRTFDRLPNPDGNFVRDFQTAGFDARVWELYLFAYGESAGFAVSRPDERPDYRFERNGPIWVEAVTAGPGPWPSSEPSALEMMADVLPIKLGSPLFSKIAKQYWLLPHVAGQPLVFALGDFHDPDPLRWPGDGVLLRYLYGLDAVVTSAPGAIVQVDRVLIGEHQYEKKAPIPSCFFAQPDSNRLSAVLFSNSGTLSKFNRMAYIANPDPNIRMIHYGVAYDDDPRALVPRPFAYVVGEEPESWGEGLTVYYNPWATVPLANDSFPDASAFGSTTICANDCCLIIRCSLLLKSSVWVLPPRQRQTDLLRRDLSTPSSSFPKHSKK